MLQKLESQTQRLVLNFIIQGFYGKWQTLAEDSGCIYINPATRVLPNPKPLRNQIQHVSRKLCVLLKE